MFSLVRVLKKNNQRMDYWNEWNEWNEWNQSTWTPTHLQEALAPELRPIRLASYNKFY